MNNFKNKVQIIGNVFSIEHREHEDNSRYVKLMIATNETYLFRTGKKSTDTMYHTCYAHGKLAEITEKFVSKGVEIAVEGKLINTSYLVHHSEAVETSVHISDLLILTNTRKKQTNASE